MLSQYGMIQQLKDLPMQRRREQESHDSLMADRAGARDSRDTQSGYMTALRLKIEQETGQSADAESMAKAAQETAQLYRRITAPGFTQENLQALCASDPGVDQVCGGGSLSDIQNKLYHSFQALEEINAELNPAGPSPGSMGHFQQDPEGAATLLEGFNRASSAGKPEPILNLGNSIYKDGDFIKNPHARPPAETQPNHTGVDAFFQARFGKGPYSDAQILDGQKAFSEARRQPGFWSDFEGGLLADPAGGPAGANGGAPSPEGLTLNDGTIVPPEKIQEIADREGLSFEEVTAAFLAGQQ